MSHKQGVRFELAPDPEHAVIMGRHAGLSRVVENFCLETVAKKWAQRKAEESYGFTGDQLTEVPWTAPALEKEWRAAHRSRFPWFTENMLSSRVPKEACRVRAAGFANYRANRKLARCRPKSNKWNKARVRVARRHLRVADQRKDFLHKTTTRLARTKTAIAVETLNVKGMAANRRLARAVSDAGFAEFVRLLEYKVGWYGSRVWKADRWFASSKTCGACRRVEHGLTLNDRTWKCRGCGVVHDRDDNAAGNLLAAMLADTEPDHVVLAGKFPEEVKRLAETA
ncbi:transposase [Nocardia sp. NBC_01730]|uniref:RNA-guided endonuclease TnpB family protein n=1 Tax=Nocardia sp. NBC_01730 TaxID=2975998 RepID=UPI002E164026|nr:transposase [Nocardia sp. NBC_01730]